MNKYLPLIMAGPVVAGFIGFHLDEDKATSSFVEMASAKETPPVVREDPEKVFKSIQVLFSSCNPGATSVTVRQTSEGFAVDCR